MISKQPNNQYQGANFNSITSSPAVRLRRYLHPSNTLQLSSLLTHNNTTELFSPFHHVDGTNLPSCSFSSRVDRD